MPLKYLQIKNWDRWQTYRKDRGQPPWIKVHRCVMRNPEWVSLKDSERGQLVAMWLLAADHNGVIPASPEVIQKLCFMTKPPNINKFTELGFIEDNWRQGGVKVASSGSRGDQPKAETEKSREEVELEEKETSAQNFELFWLKYPKKKSKGQAEKAWLKIRPSPSLVQVMLQKINEAILSFDWQKESGKYIPYPATWLNANGWEDEYIHADNRFSDTTRKNIQTLNDWRPKE